MMKRLIAVLAVSLIVSTAAFAQTTEYGRIALYADEGHSVNEVWNPGGFHLFTMYIFCLPGENGLMCAEFAIDYPDNVIPDDEGITENPGMSVALGELETGMSFCFLECQTDWVWTHSQLCYVTDQLPSQISIIEHNMAGVYQFANCLEEFPTEPCFYGPPLCFNSSCPLDTVPPGFSGVGTESSTRIFVHFDEELFAGTAAEVSNYIVYEAANPGNTLDITYAELLSGHSTVELHFGSPMGHNVTYRLEAGNIYDVAGNALPPGSSIDFTGIDNEPPVLVDAYAISPTEVAAVFNEAVTEASAEFINNYEIYREDQPSWDVPVAGAELQADGVTVHLLLGEALLFGYTYVLRVNSVIDLSGNVIPSNSTATFELPDSYPPEIVDIVTPYKVLVRLDFNEPLDTATAADPGNYGIVEKLDTLTSLAISSVELINGETDATVYLHLSDFLQLSTFYLLRISNVEDFYGNAIPPGTEYEFQYIDDVPPEINEASTLTETLIEIVYSEEMDPTTAENAANYEVYEKADPANTVTVIAAELQTGGEIVHLTLGEPLVESITYTVRVNNVQDIAGNPIDPNSTVDVVLPDTTPPEIAGATVPNVTTVDVEFNEKIDEGTAEDPSNYWLFATGNPADSIPIAGAERRPDEITVRLSLGLPLTLGNSYTLQVSGVEDLSGNPIAPGSEIIFTAEDLFPPEIVNAGASTHSLVEVVFSEEVDETTAELGVNYSVYQTDDPDPPIAVTGAVLQGDARTVHLSLGGAMTELIGYTVEVSNVEDLYGNAIDPPATFSFIMPDITPPVLVSAAPVSAVGVRVSFNEQMDPATAQTTANYEVYVTADPSSSIPVTTAVLEGSGTDVNLQLGAQLAQDVGYTVSVTGVTDAAGNPVAAGSTAQFVFHGYEGGCIGLYADDQHSDWCVNGEGFYPIDMWVWCRPSGNGLICAEFAVQFPSNTIQSTITWHPDISVTIGDIWVGLSVCFTHCFYDWVWPLHEVVYVTDPTQTMIEVVEHPDAGHIAFLNCLPESLIEPADVCTHLYLNCTDATPPELLSAEAEYLQLVMAIFNEEITSSSANDESNYLLFETANPGNTFTITNAALAGDGVSVDLTLDSPLTYGVTYTLRVSGIRDLSGNEIAPGSEVSFVPVNTPPELVSAEGMSYTEVDVLFTEPLDAVTAEDAGNYEVFATADSTDLFGVTGAVLQAGDATVRLTVDRDLTVGVDYTVRVNNVEDLFGLQVAPNSTVSFVLSDIFPPGLVSVEAIAPERLEVTFSEPLQPSSAQNPANYVLTETAPPYDAIVVEEAVLLAGGMTVGLMLESPMTFGVSYTLHVGGVRDAMGNEMPPDEIEFIQEDTFPPEFVDAVVRSEYLIDAFFDETLDPTTAEDVGNYELFELDDSLNTLSIAAADLDTSGAVVRLTLGDPVSNAVNYVLRVNNVEDLAGNPVAPNSEVVIYETDPPGLVSVTQEDMKTLLVVFDEPVSEAEAENGSSYTLHETAVPAVTINVSAASLLPDGVTVRLTLYSMMTHGTSYTLHADGVKDLYGNSVSPDDTLEFTALDTFPPELISVTPEDAHTLRIYFSEVVEETSAETVTNYEIFETGNPSSTVGIMGAVLLSSGISVRLVLDDDLNEGTDYTLRVSNVQDLAGNPVAEGTTGTFRFIGPSAMGYIGLYADADHTGDEVWYEGEFMPFTYYVWCLPSSNGMICAEFAVDASANIIRSTVDPNAPIISVSLGNLTDGMSVCMTSCQTSWTWTHRQHCYLLNDEVGFIEVIPHPDVGLHQFANCLEGYPTEPAGIISKIYINEEAGYVATLLHSFSAAYRNAAIEVTWKLTEADDGIEFFVLRAEGESGAFSELPAPRIDRHDLEFTFTDDTFESGGTYRYRVEHRIEGERRLLFETEPVETPELPLTLYQNMPNPFNPATTIRYYLPAAAHVVVEIFDVSGRRVACPVNRRQDGGHHSVEWNGIDDAGMPVSSGVYFYRLIAGRQTLSRKMVLLR
jgi:hypothetical protein